MADEETIQPSPSATQIASQLEPVFQAAIDSKSVPGVAAIALDASGDVLFSRGYGTINTDIDDAPKVSVSTRAYVLSCTKLITSVAALQLLEQGRFGLDDLVEDYVPEINKIQVLEGFEEDGSPKLRAPTTKAKIIHLFTHTTGFTYDFFDKATLAYQLATGGIPITYSKPGNRKQFETPFMFDPGQSYNYGVSTDWLGMVVEKVTGERIDQYIDKHILQPLGLKNTGWHKDIEAGNAFFQVHNKDAEGKLVATDRRSEPYPEMVSGGGYITTCIADYTQFLLTILNHGTHPPSKTQILQADTVQKYIFTDCLPLLSPTLQRNPTGANIGTITSSHPGVSSTGTFLPSTPKGWSLALMTNSQDTPNGRKAGSGAWAGLANSYYWMDPASGKLGMVLSSYFPFFDRSILTLFDALERAVYGRPLASVPGEEGSNFKGGVWGE